MIFQFEGGLAMAPDQHPQLLERGGGDSATPVSFLK